MPPRVDLTIDWQIAGQSQLLSDDESAELIRRALERESRAGSWQFAIRFVDDEEMCRQHETYLADPSPTDIMTFPYDADDEGQGGDILISVDTAVVNAREHEWSTADELRFLVLHGVLHILGWDDHTGEDRAAMLQRQHDLLD